MKEVKKDNKNIGVNLPLDMLIEASIHKYGSLKKMYLQYPKVKVIGPEVILNQIYFLIVNRKLHRLLIWH